MDHIEHAFYALSRQINRLPAPQYAPRAAEALSSLITKVNQAKRRYEQASIR